jgi:glycosyltransferase involved in cell wall biosynthesis
MSVDSESAALAGAGHTKASVALAVFNGAQFLPQQLESLLVNLRPGDEIVAVDDASTDDSVTILESCPWPDLRIIRHDKNMGVFATFETALKAAKNDIIFLCDQDDVWLPGKRDAFVHEFEADADCKAVVSDVEIIDGKGTVLLESFMATRGGFKGDPVSTFSKNRFLGCAMALHCSILDLSLPVPRVVPMHDMWLGIMAGLSGNVRFIDKVLMQYRRHGANTSIGRTGNALQIIWRRIRLSVGLLMRAPRIAQTVLRS